MDSMEELPTLDMIWDGKVEPLSPEHPFHSSISNSQFILGDSKEEYWTIDDTTIINDFLIDNDDTNCEDDSLSAEEEEEDKRKLAEDLLIELIDLKTEQWLNEENIDLSAMMKEIDAPDQMVSAVFPASYEPFKNEVTNLFEAGFGAQFSASDLTDLTPPQTPPQSPPYYKNSHNNGKTFLEPQFPHADLQLHRETEIYVGNGQYQNAAVTQNQQSSLTTIDSSILFDPVSGYAQSGNSYNCPEIALVDELLESKIKEMAPENWDGNNNSTDSVQLVNELLEAESGDSSNQYSPRSEGSSSSADSSVFSQDEDWIPTNIFGVSQKKSSSSKTSSVSKRRAYNRSSDHQDKRIRKKEQNKNAATRYRKKKKQEVEEILEEERRLKKVNKKLSTQFGDAKRELKYLKNLLREMYKAKGIFI